MKGKKEKLLNYIASKDGITKAGILNMHFDKDEKVKTLIGGVCTMMI